MLSDLGVWSAAVGQVFFSMSVGQGIMLTYGAYVDPDDDLLRSSLTIAVADIGAAIVAGLVIFPVVFTVGLEPTLGTELAFQTLPSAFETLPAGRALAVAFFGLLFFAALSSAVSLLEVGVAAATETTGLDRPRATGVLTGGVFLLGVASALSYSPVDLALLGRPVLDLVDESVGAYALPISALLVLFVFAWRADLPAVRSALGRFEPVVRFVLPIALVAVTAAKAAGVVRVAWRLLGSRGAAGAVGLALTVGVLVGIALLARLRREGSA